nr:hypothetical protein [Tanacetum cinerariifolium]
MKSILILAQVSDVVGFFHPWELTGPFISLHEQFRGGLFKSSVMGGGARVVQVALHIGEAIEHMSEAVTKGVTIVES